MCCTRRRQAGKLRFLRFHRYRPLRAGPVFRDHAPTSCRHTPLPSCIMLLPIETVLSAVPGISGAKVAPENIEALTRQLPFGAGASAGQVPHRSRDVIAPSEIRHHYFNEKENGTFEPRAHRHGTASRRTDVPGRWKRQRQDDPGQAAGRAVHRRERHAFAERAAYRRQQSRRNIGRTFLPCSGTSIFLTACWAFCRMPAIARRAAAATAAIEPQGHDRGRQVLDHGLVARPAQTAGLAGRRSGGSPVCVFDEWAADQDPVFKHVF